METDEVRISEEVPQETKKWTRSLVHAVVASTIGTSFVFGYNIGVVNAPQDFVKSFINNSHYKRSGQSYSSGQITLFWSFTVSIFCIGGMAGAFVAGPLAQMSGRKGAMLWNCLITIVGSVMMSVCRVAGSFEIIIAGRFVIGLSCGIATGVAPMYLNEIAPKSVRGFTGTLHQIMIVTGLLVSEILGLNILMGTEKLWPYLIGGGGVMAVVQLVLLPFCPESPQHLLMKGQPHMVARKVLERLRETSDVNEELREISLSTSAGEGQQVSWGEMFRDPLLRRPLIVSLVLHMSQQLCGINAVNFYSKSLFEEAGLSSTAALYAAASTGLVQLLMTFVSAVLVDKHGRRTLHLTGLALMWCFSALLTTALLWKVKFAWASYLCIVFVILYLIGFATGPGSIPWFMTAEMFGPESRARAVSLSVVVNWLSNFAVGVGYPQLQDSIKDYSFLPFTVLLTFFLLYLYRRCPETRGKSLQHVQEFFSDSPPGDLRGGYQRLPTSLQEERPTSPFMD